VDLVTPDALKARMRPTVEREALAEGIHVRRGRPTKGTETVPTVPRSVRFPAKLWKEVEAKATDLSLHSALRAAILEWAKRAP
jgi:hypothetical protein